MKVGITFGGYAPLHQGHLDLIMKAKKENDRAFVIVCGYEHEKRTEELKLNLNSKTRLIKDFLEDDVLKVLNINDTELGLDESMSDHNWNIWLNAVFSKIVKDIPYLTVSEYNIYVAEEKYKTAIDRFIVRNELEDSVHVYLLDRSVTPISGTECRANPVKNWKYITMPFRGLLSHNILIAGTASEGKTTLVNDIANYFGLVHSYEKGRDNCKWKTDDEFDAKDFIYNLYEQHKYNEELINDPANTGVFISDTDNLVTLMYAKVYSQRNNFALSEDEYITLHGIAEIYKKSTKWNKIFLLSPHTKPIVDDGERYMPDSDYEIRKGFFDILKNLYDEFGYEYEILDGTYEENYLRVRDYIRSLYE